LEKKLDVQDQCIKDQNQCILEQKQKITVYEDRLSKFESQRHREVGSPITIAEGLQIGAGATMIVQGANNTNNALPGITRKESQTDVSYSADITLAKEFDNLNSKAFLHLEAGQGAGIDDNLTLYSYVNGDARNDNNVGVSELWYEQGLFKDKAVLTFGKLDPTSYFDANDAANDETTQFLAGIFLNNPVIEFPDYTPGIRMAYMPFDWVELNYGIFDGNSDWEKIADNLLNMGQVEFKTNFFNLAGHYRFLGWNSNVNHTEWLDDSKSKESAYGFALSFDQKLNEITTLFARYGWQDPKVYNPDIMATGDVQYSLEQSWSTGLQLQGSLWGRDKDVASFAVGQIIPSAKYKKSGTLLDPGRRAKTEGHLEAYYRIHLNDHLSISPDFQYIWNPFGRDVADDTRSIFVGGMRTQVDF
jgi:carbohydrate-selective porin OprB